MSELKCLSLTTLNHSDSDIKPPTALLSLFSCYFCLYFYWNLFVTVRVQLVKSLMCVCEAGSDFGFEVTSQQHYHQWSINDVGKEKFTWLPVCSSWTCCQQWVVQCGDQGWWPHASNGNLFVIDVVFSVMYSWSACGYWKYHLMLQ